MPVYKNSDEKYIRKIQKFNDTRFLSSNLSCIVNNTGSKIIRNENDK